MDTHKFLLIIGNTLYGEFVFMKQPALQFVCMALKLVEE